uniref:Uncharacterized protein n=1 Tax=Panagrolaimus sp. ES5 TaxID=591445 RepID=A0AC34G9Q1_9BILA
MDDLQLYEEPTNPKIYIFKNFFQQDFSIPSGILHYITHSPTSCPKGYEKLQKSCKYFYLKKQLIVFSHLKWSGMQQTCRSQLNIIENFEASTYEIWLTNVLIIYGQNNQNFIDILMPKIYRSDISVLNIAYHDISFGDYKILVGNGNVKELNINDVMITNEDDGTIVPFESMLELLPNLYVLIW